MRLNTNVPYSNATRAWYQILGNIIDAGQWVTVRGKPTIEIINNSAAFPLIHPVVADLDRKLNYAFMAAEAKWVLDGSEQLAPLTAVNSRMAQFSDDGVTLAGAYGKRLVPQLPYVVDTLLDDPASRQAVATTWIRTPQPSRDIPCTLTWMFIIRDNALHLRVDMRSSDAWLGIPYDFFTFSVVGLAVWQMLVEHAEFQKLRPGLLLWSAASSHLYETNMEQAIAIRNTPLERRRIGHVYAAPVHLRSDWLNQSLRLTAAREYSAADWIIKPEECPQ